MLIFYRCVYDENKTKEWLTFAVFLSHFLNFISDFSCRPPLQFLYLYFLCFFLGMCNVHICIISSNGIDYTLFSIVTFHFFSFNLHHYFHGFTISSTYSDVNSYFHVHQSGESADTRKESSGVSGPIRKM